MSVLCKLSSKTRLISGVILSILGLLSLFYINEHQTGFLGGFIAGSLISVGIGLVITYKKKE
jgi:uncharacterized membrane protein YbhN (UPF0104 family)